MQLHSSNCSLKHKEGKHNIISYIGPVFKNANVDTGSKGPMPIVGVSDSLTNQPGILGVISCDPLFIAPHTVSRRIR